MPNFNNARKFGGNSNKKYSERSFGNKSFGGGRDSGRPAMMHKATCDDCGNVCEVPFKPTSGKPIFCSNCFKNNNGGANSGRFERRDNGRDNERRSFGGKDSPRPAMHPAVCDDCGDDCEVPFKPTGDKPIYCKRCFGKDNFKDSNRSPRPEMKSVAPSHGPTKEQFEMLNTKLDKILKLLTPAVTTPTVVASPAIVAEDVAMEKALKAKKTSKVAVKAAKDKKPPKKTKRQ